MATPAGITLGLIVEGHGEVQAAPTLIRHIARASNFNPSIKCVVRRVSKSQLLQPGELERVVEVLTRTDRAAPTDSSLVRCRRPLPKRTCGQSQGSVFRHT